MRDALSGWRSVVLLAFVVLAICGLAATPAVAEGVERMTAVEQEHLAELTEWAYRNGATVEAPDCGDVCSELWLAEHQTMPNEAASDELWGELNALEESSTTADGIALAPDLGELAFAVSPLSGAITLGASAFLIGWHIGARSTGGSASRCPRRREKWKRSGSSGSRPGRRNRSRPITKRWRCRSAASP